MGATVLGYPRIGRRRELKKALESYWAGCGGPGELEATGQAIRLDALATMSAAGLDSVPVNTFSFYDHMLDASIMVGAIPPRFSDVTGPDLLYGFDAYRYFAMARGTARVAPLEMTKWFDTNYHYLVPEIGPHSAFRANPTKILVEHAEAAATGVNARPVLVGPLTYLTLAKAPAVDAGYDPLDRLEDLTEIYAELLQSLADAGIPWVQLDEPALVKDLSADQVAEVERCYARLAATSQRPSIFVATYFAAPLEAFPALVRTGIEAIGLDLTRGVSPELVAGLDLGQTVLVLGAIDARNVWRADLRQTARRLRDWTGIGAEQAVSSSCSLMHVPYDVAAEPGLPVSLRGRLSFADQKLDEVVSLKRVLDSGLLVASGATALDAEADGPAPAFPNRQVQARLAAVTPDDRRRPARAERRQVQAERLSLPPLPTTTIGSFPQTSEVRRARADHRAGRIGEDAYHEAMRTEIARVIEVQERLGLDVLVHGEPERNDMVQYFAEQLEGYATTTHGWVQSYGSRCVRPPVLFGDVHRRQPMTVAWTAYAQGLTAKPVKGMLTGPVTMLAWSFVRDDQPLATTADQVALALREETLDLEQQGAAIIQVDEPAFRESMPLRVAEQDRYLSWATDAFRLATAGVSDTVQVHTHLCYSEFGEIVAAINRLDADVTSIEAARSSMELLAAIDSGLGGDIGPGVYDIHSPRVPETDEIVDLLRRALVAVPDGRLWVNPDCGLKTRNYSQTVRALAHLVEAASLVRAELQR
ncbi:MAG: 5-methyltetrahydropteroyltriglutamate--homocysteine S-methyltransferase [Propionicimonas sp.]